ncbi:zinc-dependent alcohol dehydrogenase family protein [Kineococcus rubinsiae]|uniref:zinc-dependent alcohol dehydrogenase family protein n=1 Tax=Kineococcus rubinsiae TaxID=2609562 RepID=UPI00142F71E5|nr:zinc-binding dehydrogenase [Kineococcus rubinsiae]NIZ90896.1 alcohol dehydrogenase catalytic domain-containing protein [Kineococcus rubinsiae]
MHAAYLPGHREVDLREVPDPTPGPGQVLVAMRASTICGSDLRAIYREHLGEGPEAYQGVVGGHEPAGRVSAVGEGVGRIRVGDRVVVYHISGCGQCDDCRRGYQISCTAPTRAAYGWQRDGGHADLLLAEERDLLVLPDELTFLDGACVACGFATAYEALCRLDVSGRGRLLVVGLGPVGLAAGLLGKAMGASLVVGTDPSPQRRELALRLGAVDSAVAGGDDELTDLLGDGAETSVDCSGNGFGQLTALRHTRRWGRAALVGEGGQLSVDVSEVLIHRQLTVHGSWVSSTVRMGELLRNLARWGLHPERVVTDVFPLARAGEAYAVADAAAGGKVGITWPDEAPAS